jgi:hypothetical protein
MRFEKASSHENFIAGTVNAGPLCLVTPSSALDPLGGHLRFSQAADECRGDLPGQ